MHEVQALAGALNMDVVPLGVNKSADGLGVVMMKPFKDVLTSSMLWSIPLFLLTVTASTLSRVPQNFRRFMGDESTSRRAA